MLQVSEDVAGNPLAVFPDAESIPEELLQPIAREMKRELLAGDYLQVDETPVRVLDLSGGRARFAGG